MTAQARYMKTKLRNAFKAFLMRQGSLLAHATELCRCVIPRQVLLLLVAGLGAHAAAADGTFCTRESGFGTLQPGICTPVQYFTPAKWTLDSVGTWKVYFVSRIEPEPAFDSPD